MSTVNTFSAFSFQSEGLIKGVPSLLEYDFSSEPSESTPPLIRAVQKMRLKSLRTIQGLEKSIINLSEWEYDGEEDETGWSEEDHQQWKVNIQLASAMASQALEVWQSIKRYDEMENRLIAKTS